MRKILLGILTVLMLVIMTLFIKNGIHLGSLQILGIQEIQNLNDELTTQINKANDINNQYTSALSKLKSDVMSMATAKKDYLDLVTISTDSEIKEATQTKTYTIEYLWSRIGNHSTKEGVVTKMDVTSSNLNGSEYKNLNFTVTGNYLAMTNFISSLENDTTLDFTIDNFDMTNQKCTFTVKDVKILYEKTSNTISSSNNSTSNPNTTTTTPETNNANLNNATATTSETNNQNSNTVSANEIKQ